MSTAIQELKHEVVPLIYFQATDMLQLQYQ